MDEPVASLSVLDPSALVRSVDGGVSLAQDDSPLIGPEKMIRPKGQLISGRDAPRRAQNPEFSLPLIDLRPFHRHVPVIRAVVDQRTLVQHREPVIAHPVDIKHVVHSHPAGRQPVDKPGAAVLHEQRAGIDPSHHVLHIVEVPPSRGIPGGKVHQPLIRQADIDMEESVPVSDAGGPGSLFVGGNIIGREGQPFRRVADQLPVDQIPGVQHRDSRQIGKGRGDHVEILPHPDHVRI